MNTITMLLCLVGILIQAAFIMVEHRQKYVPAVILKGTAAVIFCIIGMTALPGAVNQGFAKLVVVGLVFGAMGDILLNLRFVFPKNGQKIFLTGVAAFLTGHVLYLCALIPLSRNLVVCLIAGVITAVLLLKWIFSRIASDRTSKAFGIVYIGAVVLMTAVAIGNLLSAPAAATVMHAVGAVLFTVSDIVLIFNTFGGAPRFSLRITNLSLYYLGQLMIACSLFFV